MNEPLHSGPQPVPVKPSREELITRGLPLVRRVAFRMARRLPSNVDVNDLIGAGAEGLLLAVQGYDPSRVARFETYAELRIRGSILDALRSTDSMTRYGRDRTSKMARAIRKLEAELKRAPEAEEIAGALGVTLDEYWSLAEEASRGPALDFIGENDPDDVHGSLVDPSQALTQKETKARLSAAISALPARLQTVLALYYQEECTQAEIAAVLGVSEGRVSQLHGEAAARLRAALEEE